MKALILNASARTAILRNIPQPSPSPNDLLVQVHAISLNPIDPLYVAHPLGQSGRVIGSDFAGTVVALGANVPLSSNLVVGARVAGFLQGACSANERPGAFAEYVVVPWDLVWRVPDAVSMEEAAGVSLVGLTAAQAIWCRLGMVAPFTYDTEADLREEHVDWEREAGEGDDGHGTVNVLVYGASTSVALYAAQMIRLSAKASGKSVTLLGTARKARWAFLKAQPYYYDYVVDYRDADWQQQIKQLTGDAGVQYAFDCISEGESVERVCSTLARNGRLAIVRSREGGAWTANNLPVEPSYGAVWEGLGEEVQYQGFTVKRSPAARAFAVAFYKWLCTAVGSEINVAPVRLMPGGLEKVVEDGFRLLGTGDMQDRVQQRGEEWMRPVSAEKLVYIL